MDAVQLMEIAKSAIWVLLVMSLPILMTSLIVGLAVSLFQALTQIQEATLTFVPKIIAISIALIIFVPLMGTQLMEFSNSLYQRIADIEKSDTDDK